MEFTLPPISFLPETYCNLMSWMPFRREGTVIPLKYSTWMFLPAFPHPWFLTSPLTGDNMSNCQAHLPSVPCSSPNLCHQLDPGPPSLAPQSLKPWGHAGWELEGGHSTVTVAVQHWPSFIVRRILHFGSLVGRKTISFWELRIVLNPPPRHMTVSTSWRHRCLTLTEAPVTTAKRSAAEEASSCCGSGIWSSRQCQWSPWLARACWELLLVKAWVILWRCFWKASWNKWLNVVFPTFFTSWHTYKALIFQGKLKGIWRHLEKTCPWRRAWKPTPIFLPGKSMDRGAWLWAAVGCSPSAHTESDKTEAI